MGLMDIVLVHDSSTPETMGLLKEKEYLGSELLGFQLVLLLWDPW